jgi:RimJ/RimL family protein N-acetyltransferase
MNLDRNLFLSGEKIELRILSEEDITGKYAGWLNDPDVTAFNSHGRFPMTVEKLRQYVESVSSSNNTLVLAVVEKQSGSHIGNISLQSINWIDRNAEIAFLLGEKHFNGKGIMFEAGRMLINHGFNVLNLHKIYCATSSENHAMQHLAIKLGMEQEGIRREDMFKNGRYVDIIEYAIINRQNTETL